MKTESDKKLSIYKNKYKSLEHLIENMLCRGKVNEKMLNSGICQGQMIGTCKPLNYGAVQRERALSDRG